MPPGLLILLFAVIGLWQAAHRRKRSALLFLVLSALLWLLSIEPGTHMLMRGLEAEFEHTPPPAGDVIILLSGGALPFVPDLTGKGFPGPDSLSRIVTTVRLQKTLQVPVIISGGRVFADEPAIAPVLKRIMVDLGVDPQKIILEDRSRDTYENAKYAKAICLEKGFKDPIATTSAYHLKRTRLSFDRVGFKVKLYPTHFRSLPHARLAWHNLLPSHDELHASTVALHEYLGLLYYRLIL